MLDVFKGFLALRLIGLAAVAIVVAAVLGIRSLARGADVLGVAILAGAVVLAVAVAALARHARGRRR